MSLSLPPSYTPPSYPLLNSLHNLLLLSISPFSLISICVSSLHLPHSYVICFSALLLPLLPCYTTYCLLPSIPPPASLHLFLYPLRWCTSRVLGLNQSSSVIWMGFRLWVWTWILITQTHQNRHTVTHYTQAKLHRTMQTQQVIWRGEVLLVICIFIEIFFFFKVAHVFL